MRRYCTLEIHPPKTVNTLNRKYQRWSPRGRPWPQGRPRGQILMSLASKPQVRKNCPVLAQGQHYFSVVKSLWSA